MNEFQLKIVTPERVVLSKQVSQVSVSTVEGQITILPGHVPLVSRLAPGEVIAKLNSHEENLMAVSSGLVEVLPGQVVILADSAEHVEEIDEQRAEEARQRAQEILEKKVLSKEEFAFFTAQIEKELARLRVVRKHKKHRIDSLK